MIIKPPPHRLPACVAVRPAGDLPLKAGGIVPVTLEFRAADSSVSKVELKTAAGFSLPAQ